MKPFATTAVVLALSAALAEPAAAADLGAVVKAVFGTNDLKELGGPIFAAIGAVGGLVFWIALRIGKRRQARLIARYDTELADYSAKLRRGGNR